jgi:hypothetical protein
MPKHYCSNNPILPVVWFVSPAHCSRLFSANWPLTMRETLSDFQGAYLNTPNEAIVGVVQIVMSFHGSRLRFSQRSNFIAR